MKTGELIKQLRTKKGITQEELAARTDISVRTIQRIENGEVDPRAFTLQSIASVLEVDFEVLAGSEAELLENGSKQENSRWLPLLHLSGLLLLIIPPLSFGYGNATRLKICRSMLLMLSTSSSACFFTSFPVRSCRYILFCWYWGFTAR